MRRTRRQFATTVIFAALLTAVLSACGQGSEDDEGSSIEVVATTTQIADLVRNVAGQRVGLTQILQPGSDPHGFEPRPSDVAATADAALVFSNGQELDSWAEQLVSDSGSEAELVDLSTALPDPSTGHDDEHDDQGHSAENGHDSELDPHWWHDPRNAVAAIGAIAEHLAAADPAGAAEYERRAAAYSRQVERLDQRIAACIERIPPRQRKLVTDHEAFGHFADRYGLEVIGAVIPALTTQAQPSARDLSQLAEAVEQQGVTAIFPEASFSPKLAEAIAEQTGASASHTLYGDALGSADSDGATYLEMMAANARAIVDGLGAGKVRCELDAD